MPYFPYDPEEEEFDPEARPKFDESVLAAVEKENPDLVARYREKMGKANTELEDAKSAQRFAGYADVAGQALTDFGNAGKRDVILKNRMQDMGRRPEVVEAKRDQWKSLAPAFERQTASAKQAREDAFGDFEREGKFQQFSRNQKALDPKSELSQRAQMLAKSALLAKAKEASAAGDIEAANALRSQDVSGMSAADAKDFYDQLKATDYKDVLNNMAADKRLGKQIGATAQKDEKDLKKSERDMTFKLTKEYQGDDAVKRANEIIASQKQAEALAANPSPTNDISLVFAYMRSNDPRSTVREGEYAMAAQSGSLPQKWQAMYEQASTGQLPAKARSDMVRTIQTNAASAEQERRERDAYYTDQANFYQVNPDLVIGRRQVERGKSPVPMPGNTVKIQAPDGSVREVPASSAEKYLRKGGTLVK